MGIAEFENVKNAFRSADVDGKIDIYVDTEDLSKEQYGELLRMFPIAQLHMLEEALR